MRIMFVGDIVGRPGRQVLQENLVSIKEKLNIDVAIVNIENASHGFGLSAKNAHELLQSGVDIMTGGNHIWDKKDILSIIDTMPIARPINYEDAPGKGEIIINKNNENLVVINAMGMFSMPYTCNPFTLLNKRIDELKALAYENIFIDFHAEATSEKRGIFLLLKKRISAIIGTHTHIGTDDLCIDEGTAYATDIGASGCYDGIIGLDSTKPLERFLNNLPIKYEINNKCKKILQYIVMDIENGKCTDAFKIKKIDGIDDEIITKAIKL